MRWPRCLGALPQILAALVLVLAASSFRPVGAIEMRAPLTVDGETLLFVLRVYTPEGKGPFPSVIFHHGSTGSGRDPSLFPNPFDPAALRTYFISRGWAFVLPSRRGRGGSEGLYDEGFARDRSAGYTCEKALSIPGADRALRDIDVLTEEILKLPFVDRARVVIGGVSRGGILSVAYAGQRPELFKGVINFVGGWYGSPDRCGMASEINQDIFKRGVAYPGPTLWLYGDGDTFYPLAHSRSNFEAFTSAGGKGSFHEYAKPDGLNGHFIHVRPQIWGDEVDRYLQAQGLS